MTQRNDTHCNVYCPLSIEQRGSAFGVIRLNMSLACCLCSWRAVSVCKAQAEVESCAGNMSQAVTTHLLVVNGRGQREGVRGPYNDGCPDHSSVFLDVVRGRSKCAVVDNGTCSTCRRALAPSPGAPPLDVSLTT